MSSFISLNTFPSLSKSDIPRLRGGSKHNYRQYVGILENTNSDVITDVFEVKLKNQFASQKSKQYPAGYELFCTLWGEQKYCNHTSRILFPVLSSGQYLAKPLIKLELLPAVILAPPEGSDKAAILRDALECSRLKHRIRQAVAKHSFIEALDLLKLDTAWPVSLSRLSSQEAIQRFSLRLGKADIAKLRELESLLSMPSTAPLILPFAA